VGSNRFGFYPNYGYGYGGFGSYGRPGYYGYQTAFDYAPGGYYADSGYVTSGQANQQVEPPSEEKLADALDYAGQGEAAFHAGRYEDAIKLWRHALVDDPSNGAVVLLLAQAQFQQGQWEEAAGAVQQAARMIPQEHWGTIVENYKQLYGNHADYTSQLKKLEEARDSSPDSPAIRFLLGYQFGFLGYPDHAVRELDKVLELAPKDEVASQMRDLMVSEKGEGSTSEAKRPSTQASF
jgi:tetratricopeptide (TPR) repeat protein